MKTIELKLYEFNELSETAKQKALEKLCFINVDYDWWCWIYSDAEDIGLKITDFDINRRSINGELLLSAYEVSQNILNNHGECCNSFNTASVFLRDWEPVFARYMDENDSMYESREAENDLMEIENEFLSALLEDYLSLVIQNYDYYTSEAAIIETIETNSYLFTKNGELY